MNQKTIGPVTSIAIVGVALVFDGLQFLLTLTVIGSVFSWFITAVAWILFLLWFALLGVSYFGRGAAIRFLTVFASVITELVPIVNALPALTLGVVALIVQHNVAVARAKRHPGRSADKTQLTQQMERLARTRKLREARAARAANDNAPSERSEAA
ncbi:MAG TPA: hypothetical protein VFY28_00695 [Candidatus Paceibacterota bacterium]|nr:hypothetical protein [Candidatus Paceibacterota bacterium]